MSAAAQASRRRVLGRSPYYAVGIALAVLFLAPLLWSAWFSFQPQAGSGQSDGAGVGNYRALVEFGPGLGRYLLNSAIVALIAVAGTLIVGTLGGYAFARYDFRGKNVLFVVTLGILMVPYATILIPLYVLLKAIGLQGSLVGLALVLVMFQLPFAIFMLRISFEAVPSELDEAAMIDGCTSFGVLRRVLLPAVLPGLVTVALFAFLASWNEFIAPLMLLNDQDTFTLPLATVALAQQSFGGVDYGAIQAGVVVSSIPCLVLFLLLQRYYVRGFMSGALRG
jgi:multiple sugar transport system permease protein